jgi:hypothetical protein
MKYKNEKIQSRIRQVCFEFEKKMVLYFVFPKTKGKKYKILFQNPI